MAISLEEENLPMSKTVDIDDEIKDNKTNLLNSDEIQNVTSIPIPESEPIRNNDQTGRISCNYKACCLFVLVTLSVVSIACAALLITYITLLHKPGTPTTNCSPANSYQVQLSENPMKEQYVSSLYPNRTVQFTNPGILLFLDEIQLQENKLPQYDVMWKLGNQGFKRDSISFNGSRVFIQKSGDYMISISLQMEVNEFDKGTLCNLVLNMMNSQNSVYHKYTVPRNVHLPYRFIMSLQLAYKLKEGEELYISVSPRNYISYNEDSSFISIHMV